MAHSERIVNYFDIMPVVQDPYSTADFQRIFTEIKRQIDTQDPRRYQIHGNKWIFITGLKFDPVKKQILGKVLKVRKDEFPEIINTSTDELRDIIAAKNDGIAETTHFIISYKQIPIRVAFEYNHYGPRIGIFVDYFTKVGIDSGYISSCNYHPISRDDIATYRNRMNRISYVLAKVHKNNLNRLENIDTGLFSAFNTVHEISNAEYVTLYIKYDYKKLTGTSRMKDKVNSIISYFGAKMSDIEVFDTLKVGAEDQDNNNKLKDFDLLNIWVNSKIRVAKKERSKVLLSSDMFEKIAEELFKEFQR